MSESEGSGKALNLPIELIRTLGEKALAYRQGVITSQMPVFEIFDQLLAAAREVTAEIDLNDERETYLTQLRAYVIKASQRFVENSLSAPSEELRTVWEDLVAFTRLPQQVQEFEIKYLPENRRPQQRDR